jgi:hypothetical protein
MSSLSATHAQITTHGAHDFEFHMTLCVVSSLCLLGCVYGGELRADQDAFAPLDRNQRPRVDQYTQDNIAFTDQVGTAMPPNTLSKQVACVLLPPRHFFTRTT